MDECYFCKDCKYAKATDLKDVYTCEKLHDLTVMGYYYQACGQFENVR